MTAPRRWAALVSLCLATLLVMIDNTIVNVALPSMSRDLSATMSDLQWIVDAYTLAFAGLLITGGHLGDRFGRRRMLLVGIAGFAAMSIPAALATSTATLIVARVGLGVFAALVFPATLALLTSVFTVARERAAAFGIWAATAGVAVAIGPVLGGWLIEHGSWASVFWINLPFAAVVAVAVVLLVPAARPAPVGRADVLGLALSVAAMGLLIYSVIEGPRHGWTDWRTLGGFVLAAALLAVFVRRQLRSEHPVLDVRVFRDRRFAAASGLIALAFFCLFGFIFLITQYFQAVKGYGTLSAGLHTLPFAVVMAVVSPVAMQAVRRVGVAAVSATGALLMAGGFALVQFAGADASYWGLIVWSMSAMAAGLALISGPCTHVVMTSLPEDRAGAGAAVNDTTREFGGALGVAVLGSVLSSVYASGATNSAVLQQLPEQARDIARTSVVAGVEVAQQAPAQFAGPVLDAVRDAFVTGLHQSVWVAVAVAALAAPAAYLGLRGAAADQTSTVIASPPARETQESIQPASRSAVVSSVSR
ncbi:MFS transporter [Williamsia deligens]|uniref:MFS transporter n=1 Tax=Williamsia deligens TaxID=321325 RepID=A0ABW3G4W1_9NOCA|nr:MFS transporter [Williamsia deligens]MCP2194166.1 drug resistance transporter, EmrB/QacA subfamily [Williamsia deligens]